MTATFNGAVSYRSVIGSSLRDRTAFDGSVPYSVSCSGDIHVNSTADSSSATLVTSLIGSPGSYSVSNGSIPSGVVSALTKQCVINLRDIWFDVSFSDRSDFVWVTIAACDPASFPSGTAEHTFLYQGIIHSDGSGHISVPDIFGLVVSSGLNIVLQLTFSGFGNGDDGYISYHCVADIDD